MSGKKPQTVCVQSLEVKPILLMNGHLCAQETTNGCRIVWLLIGKTQATTTNNNNY